MCLELRCIHNLLLVSITATIGFARLLWIRLYVLSQPEPGVYNDEVLAGLDYLMMELGKRDMTAVLYFNNAWEWSGGYTQYVEGRQADFLCN